jgi:hypothetical protein
MLTADEKAQLIRTAEESGMVALAIILIVMVIVVVLWDEIDLWVSRRKKP